MLFEIREENIKFLLSLKLIDEKDKSKYLKKLYMFSNNTNKFYNSFKIKKPNGKYRKINEPEKTLKYIQRNILEKLLYKIPVSNYATAYQKNLKLVDNAKNHLNKNKILKLDIESFFDHITFLKIYEKCFENYFPKDLAMLFTHLCTKDDSLPTGAPTSAYISNIILKDFDEKIGLWCQIRNISFSRYSDDMTFSGEFDPKEVIKKVKSELSINNLRLNSYKTKVINRNYQQNVTGIVVNKKLQTSKKYRNKIRQEIYYIKKFGIESHLKMLKLNIDQNDYLKSIYGRVLYVLQINKNDKEFLCYKDYINSMKN